MFCSKTLHSQKRLRIINTVNDLLMNSHCHLTAAPLQITAMVFLQLKCSLWEAVLHSQRMELVFSDGYERSLGWCSLFA